MLQLLLHEGALTEAELIEHVVACVEAHARAAKANNLRVPPTEEGRQEFMRKIVLEDISEAAPLPSAAASYRPNLTIVG